MDKTTEQIQTLTPHTTVIGSRPLGTKLYIYKHFQLIFSFTTVILVQTWLDSHICLIVKNPYVLVCKRNCSWCETVGRTCCSSASFYSSYVGNGAKVRVTPPVVMSCFCPCVLPGCDHLIGPSLQIPATLCVRSQSGEPLLCHAYHLPPVLWGLTHLSRKCLLKRCLSCILLRSNILCLGFFFIRLEFGWAGF